MTSSWRSGDYLTHRFNPELGIGRVTAVEGRVLVVDFPRTKTRLRLAASTDVLSPIDLDTGRAVRIVGTGEETSVIARLADGTLRLANGRTVAAAELWPLQVERSLLERLAARDRDDARDFLVRLDVLRLLSLRQAGGLGSFLGGRVRLFPHQLHVAERATAAGPGLSDRIDPVPTVRWLLADEVGLGKTIEASLILNRLVHAGQVERCLVVAPDALTVQWLGELWRKYHQVFTLLDSTRLTDVARDFGPGFNPFDVHRRAVIALEMLIERPELTAQAVAAGIDLLVVDEAQRLRRPPGHPGEPGWRAIAPIAALGRHVLLLSATPLEDDAHGFFRLLQLLRPEEFPEDISFEERLSRGVPLPPCTSSTRRSDIGGLPPRVGIPIAFDDAAPSPSGDGVKPFRETGSNGAEPLRETLRNGAKPFRETARDAVETAVRSMPAPHAVARLQKLDRIRRALASGAALAAVVGQDERELRAQAEAMDAADPRVRWLLSQAPRWRDANEKTLVFVAHRETLEMVRTALSHGAQLATGVFHEELSPARRDTEVARFREERRQPFRETGAPQGPSLLVTTECGGEGRNFEFCRRLVLFDLPWNPMVVEQRIGRLDRIGRRIPVEIVYFRPPGGIGADVVRLFEALDLFREPLAGLEPQLASIESALEEIALDPEASLSDAYLERLITDAHAARTRIREAAYQQLHRDPYRAEMAAGILARVPAELDGLIEKVVVKASERLGFSVERLRGRRKFAIEFGSGAVVDSLPGVAGGSAFVGSFDREEAVDDETIDFFASGHALVEGLLAHVEDSTDGRVAFIEVKIGQAGAPAARFVRGGVEERGEGVVAVYKDGPGVEVVAVDAAGRLRPEWAAAFDRRPLLARRMADDVIESTDWAGIVRRAEGLLDRSRRPHAVAAVAVRPE